MVWAQLEEKGQWEKAVVKSIHDSRSYWITTETGGEYRRNRVHLRPRVPSAPKIVPAYEAGPAPKTTAAAEVPAGPAAEVPAGPAAATLPVPATTAAAEVPVLPRSSARAKKNVVKLNF